MVLSPLYWVSQKGKIAKIAPKEGKKRGFLALSSD
jgi:hypothetical protein